MHYKINEGVQTNQTVASQWKQSLTIYMYIYIYFFFVKVRHCFVLKDEVARVLKKKAIFGKRWLACIVNNLLSSSQM